jgi:Xaa-Pro aminopeptidase
MISRLGKLMQIRKTRPVDAFLITSPASVKYFSGYFFYFEYGSSPFHLLPAMLMLAPDQEASLLLADNESGHADAVDPLLTIRTYDSYTFEKAGDPTGSFIRNLRLFIDRNHLGACRIGVEPASFPLVAAKALEDIYPSIRWVDLTQDVARNRWIKDEDEIRAIRQAAALADLGQEAVLKYAQPGMRELELFALAHRDMEAVVGHRIPLMADLSTGQNTNAGGGMPTNAVVQPGDLILSDFQPCLDGYWGDSCNTMAVGGATREQKEIFALVKEALDIGIAAIKPGIPANRVDRLMRDHIGNYPHHSGHSVGTAYHEYPRITPYNDQLLEAGMFIALEPAIYKKEYGIRLEHLMLVTAHGAEVITRFRHRLEP